GLARLAASRGQLDSAVGHLRGCTKHPTTRKAALTLLAELHRRRGDPAAAAEACRQAANLSEDLPWPDPWRGAMRSLLVGRHALLARLKELQLQGHLREASEVAAKAANEYPELRCFALGRRCLDQGKWAEAEAAIREGLALNAAFVEGHFDLGR